MSQRLGLRLTVRMLMASALAVATGTLRAVFGRSGGDVMLLPGDMAPAFSLPGSDGQQYQLDGFRGQTVVIAWFPKAFTGGCTTECRSLSASLNALSAFHVRPFGASVDRPATNRQFAAALGLDYPILSDTTKGVARAYGVLSRSGYPRRWTFYIGEDGRILYVDKSVRPRLHGEDVADRLRALKVPRRS